MKTAIVAVISIVGAAVAIAVGFLVGYSVRDTVNVLDRLHVKEAICTFNGNDDVNNEVNGDVRLIEFGTVLHIVGNLSGIEGRHGFHIHEMGNLGNGCTAAKGHFNPYGVDHGAPMDTIRHLGDLGNIDFISRRSTFNVSDALVKLNGPDSVIGRSFVIHHGIDDLGKGGAYDSKKTGAAGPRLACCVIGIAKYDN